MSIMSREAQKTLALKFVEASGKWDTDAMSATLDDGAKHDLLPASLGVTSKDNAGKIQVTRKLATALGNKPVNVSRRLIKLTPPHLVLDSTF